MKFLWNITSRGRNQFSKFRYCFSGLSLSFFFSNRTKYRKNIWNIHVSYCFIVFYIFYLVIKNIFKRELKREKTGKNLKIDSANFYQNQIFQDTDILFLFSIFQHIHHTVSFIQYTYSNDRNDKNFLIIPLHNLPRRSQNLSTEKRRKEDFTALSSQYLPRPIGRFFVGIRACLIPT